jgi:predicted dienelactone hydrolase
VGVVFGADVTVIVWVDGVLQMIQGIYKMNNQSFLGQGGPGVKRRHRLMGMGMVRLLLGCWVSLGLMEAGYPRPGFSAEQLTTRIGDRTVTVTIDEIEQFAKTGQVSPAFTPIAQTLDDKSLQQLRGLLQTPILPLSQSDVERLSGTTLFQPLIKDLGTAIQPTSGKDSSAQIRTALQQAAAAPQGLTLLNILRAYPDQTAKVNLPYLTQLTAQLTVLSRYRTAAVKAVEQTAHTEQTSVSAAEWAQLPDVRQAGPYGVEVRSLRFSIAKPRPTQTGEASSYILPVDLYLPQNAPQPAPLIVFSHGFGAHRDAYAYLARHLASYGFAVAAPEHLGSNLDYRRVFLAGKLPDLLEPQELISRSLDIIYLLDELEKQVAANGNLAGVIDVNQVGVLGNSLGATTALSVAGAPLNFQRLRADCTDNRPTLSMSFLVQCVAKTASKQPSVNLGDRRIKAVLAAYPLTSSIFGPESLSQITVPTLMLGGSNDLIAPVVQDQIHPFLWLKTPEKYLMLMVPGTHFSTSEDANVRSFPPALVGPGLAAGRTYLQAMSTAFFKRHLANLPDYQPLLTAAYAASIRRTDLALYLTRALTASQLEQSFGSTPPTPVFPQPVATK